ncbi:MAG: tetratricopeptide repeat protein [Terrimesophilobacter sp.]
MSNLPPAANLRGAVDLSSLVKPHADAAGASEAGGTISVPALVIDATDATFGALLELSKTVAVIVELHAGTPSAGLERTILGFGGRFLLARVHAQMNPQLSQAFQVAAAPTVAAVIGGRPVALYEGELPEADAQRVFEQVATLAEQNGVTGRATAADAQTDGAADADAPEPVEEPLPPHHQEAFDAIDRGDFATAIKEYQTAIAQNPRDQLAVAGLAQVSLLDRLSGQNADDIRVAAAADPTSTATQFAVADLDVSGGHLEDAFDRLLTLYPSVDIDQKDAVRTRLLSYFEIAGSDDPRVIAARRRLAALLY